MAHFGAFLNANFNICCGNKDTHGFAVDMTKRDTQEVVVILYSLVVLCSNLMC